MAPSLDDGDHVLLRRYGRFRRPRPGDVACIRRADEPMLIKRLGTRDADGRFALSGDGAASAPAMDLGFAADHEIVGRAILRLSGNRIRLIRHPPRPRESDTEALVHRFGLFGQGRAPGMTKAVKS